MALAYPFGVNKKKAVAAGFFLLILLRHCGPIKKFILDTPCRYLHNYEVLNICTIKVYMQYNLKKNVTKCIFS